MTKLQTRMYNGINDEIDNVLAEMAYEAISGGLKEEDLDNLDEKLKADLRAVLTQILKEV